ncbi:hypothetical protein K461DRAFT_268513 [Myriangium duriaei CBS 260.36]|uniref:Uncharacterized protein n=1 Tax=Myriangium duriaei CBS 260.36 TaxID=1168546 RepID=A0A9P4MFN3_9PEZI|nr:hypothetical protein K461DRAFT_268513 [Myriangium duriaei CBS 260.36]
MAAFGYTGRLRRGSRASKSTNPAGKNRRQRTIKVTDDAPSHLSSRAYHGKHEVESVERNTAGGGAKPRYNETLLSSYQKERHWTIFSAKCGNKFVQASTTVGHRVLARRSFVVEKWLSLAMIVLFKVPATTRSVASTKAPTTTPPWSLFYCLVDLETSSRIWTSL